MTLPTGKGAFIHANTRLYPASDPIGWARAVGLSWVLLHVSAAPELLRAALRAGLRVWWWAGPPAFTPETWRHTISSMARRIRNEGGEGGVVDKETADEWAGQLTEVQALAAAVESAPGTWGLTSFPAAGHLDTLAPSFDFLLMQLYGRGLQGEELHAFLERWGDRWDRRDGETDGELHGVPVGLVAAAYRRTPAEQAEYLAELPPTSFAALWTGAPAELAELTPILRQWRPDEAVPFGFRPERLAPPPAPPERPRPDCFCCFCSWRRESEMTDA